jgi:hypothetical protein
MCPMSYTTFGDYLGRQSPYSQPGDVTFDAGYENISLGLTKVATPADVPFDHLWTWRHDRPWENEPNRPGRPTVPWKVQSYQIVKAMLVPYTYKRYLMSTFGGTTETDHPTIPGTQVVTPYPGPGRVAINIKGHLLIGYTATGFEPTTPVVPPATSGAGPGDYTRLGEFIKNQTPHTTAPTLLGDLSVPNPATTPQSRFLETAVTWLSNVSADGAAATPPTCELESNSDMEMDLIQEQQCLYWGFPLALDSGGGNWLRNFQVTKAFRATYEFTAPHPTTGVSTDWRGDVLVGVTGAGDM